jgi:hypothetical protein
MIEAKMNNQDLPDVRLVNDDREEEVQCSECGQDIDNTPLDLMRY